MTFAGPGRRSFNGHPLADHISPRHLIVSRRSRYRQFIVMTKSQVESAINLNPVWPRVSIAFDYGFGAGLSNPPPAPGGAVMGIPFTPQQINAYLVQAETRAWAESQGDILPLPEPGNPSQQHTMLSKILEDSFHAGFVSGVNTRRHIA